MLCHVKKGSANDKSGRKKTYKKFPNTAAETEKQRWNLRPAEEEGGECREQKFAALRGKTFS